MQWLKRFGRSRARPVLSRGSTIAPFGQWPQNYEAQVRVGYCRNAVAQRAVKLMWALSELMRGRRGKVAVRRM